MMKFNLFFIFIYMNLFMDECGWEYGIIFDLIFKFVVVYF